MLKDIVAAIPPGSYRLHVKFDDGVEGVLDLAQISFHGVFQTLRDQAYFAQVRFDPDIGTIAWPNGSDFDPDVLYATITGAAILL